MNRSSHLKTNLYLTLFLCLTSMQGCGGGSSGGKSASSGADTQNGNLNAKQATDGDVLLTGEGVIDPIDLSGGLAGTRTPAFGTFDFSSAEIPTDTPLILENLTIDENSLVKKTPLELFAQDETYDAIEAAKRFVAHAENQAVFVGFRFFVTGTTVKITTSNNSPGRYFNRPLVWKFLSGTSLDEKNIVTALDTKHSSGNSSHFSQKIITLHANLPANAADHQITIDGVTIDFGTKALTREQIAQKIANTDFSSGGNYTSVEPYYVGASGYNLIFQRRYADKKFDGSIPIQDNSYTGVVHLAEDAGGNSPVVAMGGSLGGIDSLNGGAFRVFGTCSEEEQKVVVKAGGLSPKKQPSCLEGAWSVHIDLSGVKASSVTITADHSSSKGIQATQARDSVTNSFICPSDFVPVPGLKNYTAEGFCVAKYEMKDNGSNEAVSQVDDIPWVDISKSDAKDKCVALGAGYDLITNDEWQTLARNIELVESNWQKGIGSSLPRGHSDKVPEKLLAAGDDNNPCFETGQSCSASTWGMQKRTHKLSNGQLLWDVAGNADEWVKDDNSAVYGLKSYIVGTLPSTYSDKFALSGGTTTTSRAAKAQFGPRNSYLRGIAGGNLGLGYAYFNRGKGITRGGSFRLNAYAGIFATKLSIDSNSISPYVGFRCVYRFP